MNNWTKPSQRMPKRFTVVKIQLNDKSIVKAWYVHNGSYNVWNEHEGSRVFFDDEIIGWSK